MLQTDRYSALDKFKNKKATILVVTDIASRGLDIPLVDFVINFDIPKLIQNYIHRVGRTARAWRGGFALSFVTQNEIKNLHKIEAFTGRQLELYNIAEQQILDNITRICKAKKDVIHYKNMS